MNRPIEKYRVYDVNAACFENEGRKSYTFQVSYKDKENDEWKNTNFFNINQLRRLRDILNNILCDSVIIEKMNVNKPDIEVVGNPYEDIPF